MKIKTAAHQIINSNTPKDVNLRKIIKYCLKFCGSIPPYHPSSARNCCYEKRFETSPRSKRCGLFCCVQAELELNDEPCWLVLLCVVLHSFPCNKNESAAVSRIFGLRQVRLYSPENSTHIFCLASTKTKKKVTFEEEEENNIEFESDVKTDPGSQACESKSQTFLVICKYFLFDFWILDRNKNKNDSMKFWRKRSNICGYQVSMNIYEIFGNFFEQLSCFWRRKKMRLKKLLTA